MGNYYIYRLGQWLVSILPKRTAYAFAVFISDIHFLFSKTDREAVRANLTAVVGKNVSPKMVREVFRNFGRFLVDFFTLTKKVTPRYIKEHVECVNIEHIDHALKKGKGALLVSAHVGNWEMAGAVVSSLGYPLAVIALLHKDPRVNAFFDRQRVFFGTTVIPTTTTAVRRCLEHLKANRVLAIMGERDFGTKGIVMGFLGRKAMIPKGTALFSLKTGAPIIPTVLARKDNGDFCFIFHTPIEPPAVPKEGITDALVAQTMGRYLRVLEGEVREHPLQWLMFREFWHS